MRSVFFIFEEKEKKTVTNLLDCLCDESFFIKNDDKQWNIISGKGALYIYIYPAEELFAEIENEDKTYFYKLNSMNHPLLNCQIDISGRFDGTIEVKNLLTQLLESVNGYAMDDYTGYFWSSEQIKNGSLVEGHPFFDYKGW